jgi:hypothetical protein
MFPLVLALAAVMTLATLLVTEVGQDRSPAPPAHWHELDLHAAGLRHVG